MLSLSPQWRCQRLRAFDLNASILASAIDPAPFHIPGVFRDHAAVEEYRFSICPQWQDL